MTVFGHRAIKEVIKVKEGHLNGPHTICQVSSDTEMDNDTKTQKEKKKHLRTTETGLRKTQPY
jgi:hypothetical protein